MSPATVYLGLGANLGDTEATLREAIARLEDDPTTRVTHRARLYRSRPVGPPGQPDYLNTAVAIETALEPRPLLEHVKRIERDLGREPSVRWGPRAVDLDLLLYGGRQVKEPDLVIPHVELPRRRFVLAPLADIAPDVVVPGLGRTVSALLGALDDDPADVAVDLDASARALDTVSSADGSCRG